MSVEQEADIDSHGEFEARGGVVPFPPMTNSNVVGLASVDLLSESATHEIAIAIDDISDGDSVPGEVLDLIWPLVTAFVSTVNSQFFHFELTSIAEPGQPAVRKFDQGDHDLRDLMLDGERSNRKLAVLVPLGFPDGVQVAVSLTGPDKARSLAIGEAVAFPAYLHAVASITGEADERTPDGTVGRDPLASVMVLHALGPAFT